MFLCQNMRSMLSMFHKKLNSFTTKVTKSGQNMQWLMLPRFYETIQCEDFGNRSAKIQSLFSTIGKNIRRKCLKFTKTSEALLKLIDSDLSNRVNLEKFGTGTS